MPDYSLAGAEKGYRAIPGIVDIERKLFATELRLLTADELVVAGSGHTGTSLSCADLVTVLYHPDNGLMKYKSCDPGWEERDRFVLNGHGAPVIYAALAMCGFFPKNRLYTLRKPDGLQGHVSIQTPGIDISTGSLGQELSMACGIASAVIFKKKNSVIEGDPLVYCLLGDGGTDEGQVWEAARDAQHRGLNNVFTFINYNGLRIDGDTSEVFPLGERFKAFGWNVLGKEIPWAPDRQYMDLDGHDCRRISSYIEEAMEMRKNGKPSVIILNTVKAKGIPAMENKLDSHGRVPKKGEYDEALRYLTDLKLETQRRLYELRAG